MPLPEHPPFEDLLGSLTPVATDDLVAVQVLPPSPARDEATRFIEGECKIWYRPCASLTFDALAARVEKELAKGTRCR